MNFNEVIFCPTKWKIFYLSANKKTREMFNRSLDTSTAIFTIFPSAVLHQIHGSASPGEVSVRDGTMAGTGDRLPRSSDWHTNSSQAAEVMQHSSSKFINSNNPKLSPTYSAKFSLSSVGSASHHTAAISRLTSRIANINSYTCFCSALFGTKLMEVKN